MSAVCRFGGQLGSQVTAWAGAPRPGCRRGSVTSQLGDFGGVRQFLKVFVSLRMKRVLILLPPRVTEKLDGRSKQSTPRRASRHGPSAADHVCVTCLSLLGWFISRSLLGPTGNKVLEVLPYGSSRPAGIRGKHSSDPNEGLHGTNRVHFLFKNYGSLRSGRCYH